MTDPECVIDTSLRVVGDCKVHGSLNTSSIVRHFIAETNITAHRFVAASNTINNGVSMPNDESSPIIGISMSSATPGQTVPVTIYGVAQLQVRQGAWAPGFYIAVLPRSQTSNEDIGTGWASPNQAGFRSITRGISLNTAPDYGFVDCLLGFH